MIFCLKNKKRMSRKGRRRRKRNRRRKGRNRRRSVSAVDGETG